MAQIRLIGTDPSQVSTNGMLGNLAFQNAESVSLEKLIVTGDVGIGTLMPASRLEIVGNASSDAKVTFSRVPVQSSNDGVIGELFFQNNTDSIALISVKRQSAADDAYIQFATQQSGGGLTERLRITSTGTVNILGAGTAGSTQAVSFSGTAPVNSLVLNSSGRVGIGTTGPSTTLEVRKGGTNTVSGHLFSGGFTQTIVSGEPQLCLVSNIDETGNSGSIEAARGGIGFSWANVNDRTRFIVGTDSNHPLRLYTNASEKVRISETGNVGIGTTNPIAKLQVVGSTELSELSLSSITSTTADTAVDVFVYDTRKDSDGGAWRKRTQRTSWYNETLNTATRGARKEFPAVAVIVSTLTTVTIYDGDDPDMPMWMVFLGSEGGMSSQRMVQYINQQGYYLHALNGILVIGQKTNNDNYGSPIIRFISEYVNRMDPNTGSEGGVWNGTIADRNTTSGYRVSSTETYAIVNSIINDVAMTVLPNAPIDPSTGLPVPTIAVATNGGVSVIKDDGSVVNSTSNATYPAKKIKILPNGELYHTQGTSPASNEGLCFNIPFTRISGVDLGYYANSTTFWYGSAGIGNTSNILGSSTLPLTDVVNSSDSLSAYTANSSGLSQISISKESLTRGMVAYITTSYSSGWMNGDIKGAFLSDTSTASVTGTELVTNGNFSGSDLSSYFQVNNCSLAVVSNQLVMTSNTGNYYCEFYISITDTTKPHYLSFQFVGASNLIQFGIYAGATGYVTDTQAGWSNPSYVTDRNAGTYTILIPAGNSKVGFVFPSPAVYTWTFDNISLKPVQEVDRSVNNRGLAVYGTLTKSAVATGANLVAYTNSTGSNNYLVLPLSTSIINLTSDFSVSYWFNCNGTQYNGWNIVEDDISSQVAYSKTVLSWFVQAASTMGYRGSSITASNDLSYPTNVWNFITITKTSSGIRMFLNGNLISSTAGSCANPSVPYSLRLFQWSYSTQFFNGAELKMSLFRLSQSVPSPTQILKIYNDEKALFQENSQCTLYGSSDAVTALAYDDTTRLLSVGTSSGRSDFNGLKRINNTTTAVTTAISASNGLIVEQ